MKIMPSSNTGFQCGVLFGRYPDRLAHLQNVDCPKQPSVGIPFAIDNGVFGCWQNGKEWKEEPFYRYLEEYAHFRPLWVVVPDAVGDRDLTLAKWDQHASAVSAYGVPMAFAVQDGMTVDDVSDNADVVFVGGTTSWKWRNLTMWTEAFDRVHVGRVNTPRLLEIAERAGAESCDGTGWFRDPSRTRQLEMYLQGNNNEQMEFGYDA